MDLSPGGSEANLGSMVVDNSTALASKPNCLEDGRFLFMLISDKKAVIKRIEAHR